MEKEKQLSLHTIGKDLPFTVPDNYFEELAIQMDSLTTGKVISVKGMIRSWMYLAAMFLGIFFIGHFFFKMYQSTIEKNEIYELYLLSQIDEEIVFDFYMENFEYDE